MNPLLLIFFRWGENTNHFLVDQKRGKVCFFHYFEVNFLSKMRLRDEKCPSRDIDSIHTMYGVYGNGVKAFPPIRKLSG